MKPKSLLTLSIAILVGIFFMSICAGIGTTNFQSNTNTSSSQQTQTNPNQPSTLGITTTSSSSTISCEVNKETSRICSACNIATVTYLTANCAISTKEVDDNSCTSLCPKASSASSAPAIQYTQPEQSSPKCCKYCSKGKACGDSCINKNYTCHVGAGCACNS